MKSGAVLAIHQVPSLTRERYEEVVRRLTNGKSRLSSLSDAPFEGLIVHAAAQTNTGFLIVDVFESDDAFHHFNMAIAPFSRGVGIKEPPTAYPAHTFIRD